MKWGVKRINKHLLIHNHCYFKEFAIGVLIGKTDMGLTFQFDLFFIGITIII
jgi:hypothetical protein